ncbi:uncharacterized protein LOC131674266 isoform X3 [Phymastichus coffea]|uniref:uncharacterized protein LOC131674266 isoform X3 n=1 Tax=Phymastichus coffea TaxID=108790 RepID=UPI00273A7622|nr:uncharacterized protein LOC131674266 isoform X3 [Phymastichus coffea]
MANDSSSGDGGGGGATSEGCPWSEADEEQAGASCPPVWDTLMCWPRTAADSWASMPCFAEIGGIRYDTSQNASKWCWANGTWEHYSNYTQCAPLYDALDESEPTSSVEVMTRLYLVGYGLSLCSLLVAVAMYLRFRELRCLRNAIHANLMASYILADALWIATVLSQVSLQSSRPTCALFFSLYHYFQLTNFFWMFVEGLYLYLLVVKTFSGDGVKLTTCLLIGWGARPAGALPLDGAPPVRLALPGAGRARALPQRAVPAEDHVGAHHQAALGQRRRDSAVPQGRQGAARAHPAAGRGLRAGPGRAQRRPRGPLLRVRPRGAALHAGLLGGALLLLPQQRGTQRTAPPLPALGGRAQSGRGPALLRALGAALAHGKRQTLLSTGRRHRRRCRRRRRHRGHRRHRRHRRHHRHHRSPAPDSPRRALAAVPRLSPEAAPRFLPSVCCSLVPRAPTSRLPLPGARHIGKRSPNQKKTPRRKAAVALQRTHGRKVL